MKQKKRCIVNAACLLIATFLWGCAHMSEQNKPNDTLQPWHWFDAEGPKKGVAIVVHGLNLRPSAMDEIAQTLSKSGIDVLRVALFGHRGNGDEPAKVGVAVWQKDLLDAYQVAEKKAKSEGLPLFFVGYSLGALLNLQMLADGYPIHYDRMILLAPALSVRWYTRLVRSFEVLGDEFMLKSAAPKEYRANDETAVGAFRALFLMLQSLEKNRFKNTNIPTLIVVDQKDELVSPKGIRDAIADHQLTNWRLFYVNADKIAHHLVIDHKSMSETEWQKLQIELVAYFLKKEDTP